MACPSMPALPSAFCPLAQSNCSATERLFLLPCCIFSFSGAAPLRDAVLLGNRAESLVWAKKLFFLHTRVLFMRELPLAYGHPWPTSLLVIILSLQQFGPGSCTGPLACSGPQFRQPEGERVSQTWLESCSGEAHTHTVTNDPLWAAA